MLNDLGRTEAVRGKPRARNGFLDGSRGQLPAKREVVTPTSFLHQGLDVVAPTGLKADQGGLLLRILGPFAGGRPTRHEGNGALIGRGVIGAQEEGGTVIARDPKPVVSVLRRLKQRREPLAIVVRYVCWGLETAEDFIESRRAREGGIVREVGYGRAAADAAPHFTQDTAGLAETGGRADGECRNTPMRKAPGSPRPAHRGSVPAVGFVWPFW